MPLRSVALLLAVVLLLVVGGLAISPAAALRPGEKAVSETALSSGSVASSSPGAVREAAGDPGATNGLVEWPTLSFDLQRTAANLQESVLGPQNASHLSPLWTFSTPGGVTDSLAVVNGTAYFGDWNGSLYAVNAYTGALEWRTDLGGPFDYTNCGEPGISSTATVSNNTVYIGGSSPWEYAVNASTGAILWHVDLANSTGSSSPWTAYKAWSTALVVHGELYVGTSSGCDDPLVRSALLQISLASHQVQHLFYTINATDLGNSIWSSPSYDAASNTVWVTTGNGLSDVETYSRSIMAFNATNVSELVGYAQEAAPFHDYDFGDGATIFHNAEGVPMVVAINKNGYAYAFNLSTFRGNDSAHPAWSVEVATVPGVSYSPPAFDGNLLYFGSSNTTLANATAANGSIRAVYPGNGTTKWVVALPYSVFGGLTYANGLIVAGLTGGFQDPTQGGLVILNATNGAALYYRAGPASWGAPVVVNGELLFTSGNLTNSTGGAVTALALPLSGSYSATPVSGEPESTYQLRAAPTGGVLPYNLTWTFGDGAVAYGVNVSHAYGAPGSYPCSLTFRDPAGQVATQTFSLAANAPLAAVASVGPDPIPLGGATWLRLNVTGAVAPYGFDWGGLPPNLSAGGTPGSMVAGRPSANGVFNVTTEVSSPTGQALLVRFPALTVGGPSSLSIGAQPTYGPPPLTVAFSPIFPASNVTATYVWQFGDGGGSSQPTPVHQYRQMGSYSVTLTVVYPGGTQATATLRVVVSPVTLGEIAVSVGLGAGVGAAAIGYGVALRRRKDP